MSPETEAPPKTPVWVLALAWGFVSIPLAWGVYETLLKSLPLFRGN